MSKKVQFEGVTHEFPDDATDEEIASALEAAHPKVGSNEWHQQQEAMRQENMAKQAPGKVDDYGESGLHASGRTTMKALTSLPEAIVGVPTGLFNTGKQFVSDLMSPGGAIKAPLNVGKNMVEGGVNLVKDTFSGDPDRSGRAAANWAVIGGTAAMPKVLPKIGNASTQLGMDIQDVARDLPSATPGGFYHQTLVRSAIKPGMRLMGKGVENTGRLMNGTYGSHQFAQRPLHAQMGELPIEGGQYPPTAAEGPLPQEPSLSSNILKGQPFHEQPLWMQMEAGTPEMQMTENPRSGGPVARYEHAPNGGVIGRNAPPQAPPGTRLVKRPSITEQLVGDLQEGLPNKMPETSPGLPPSGLDPRISGLANDESGAGLTSLIADMTPEMTAAKEMYTELVAKGYNTQTAAKISGFDPRVPPTSPAGRVTSQVHDRILRNGGR